MGALFFEFNGAGVNRLRHEKLAINICGSVGQLPLLTWL